MKRNIFLLLGLIGLVVLENGCDDRGREVQNGQYEIIGIDTTLVLAIDSAGNILSEVDDTISYDGFLVRTTFIDDYVVAQNAKHYSQNALYAAPLPAPSLGMELDSIVIVNIADEDSLVVTANFVLETEDWDNYQIALTNDSIFRLETKNATSWNQLSYHFKMITQPIIVSEMKLHFIYYLTSGVIFETTTEPIIVTP